MSVRAVGLKMAETKGRTEEMVRVKMHVEGKSRAARKT